MSSKTSSSLVQLSEDIYEIEDQVTYSDMNHADMSVIQYYENGEWVRIPLLT